MNEKKEIENELNDYFPQDDSQSYSDIESEETEENETKFSDECQNNPINKKLDW